MENQLGDQPLLADVVSQQEFEQVLTDLRPKLHAYCARMTGSVIDGEDIVQATLVKAYEAFLNSKAVNNWQAWLFQIAHNLVMDQHRRKSHHDRYLEAEGLNGEVEDYEMTNLADNLPLLMTLPPLQRSVFLLRELYEYKASEVGQMLHTSESAVKSALNRARTSLKSEAENPVKTESAVNLSNPALALVKQYSELFNRRQFDDIRQLLTDEVKLDMVNKAKLEGLTDVGGYYGNYERRTDWRMEPGFVEGKPAVLAFESGNVKNEPVYFIRLEFEQDRLRFIQDFRYARYVMDQCNWQKT